MGKVRVLLVLAAGPGFPEGSTAHRHEMTLVLDAAGRPDAAAWWADPEPWAALRIAPGEAPAAGDVQHDAAHGWSLRLFGAADEGADAPAARLDFGTGPVRPGAHVTVTDANGAAFAYRIVAVG